jgi:hypothetical protein
VGILLLYPTIEEPDVSDENETSNDHEEDHSSRRLRNFDLRPRTQEEARRRAAIERFWELERMLYHLYAHRPVSDPNMYPIAPETLEPDYVGPEDTGFPFFDDEAPQYLLASIGRLVAALGGHLEVLAVFPDTTITLLVEPGPEHLSDEG